MKIENELEPTVYSVFLYVNSATLAW